MDDKIKVQIEKLVNRFRDNLEDYKSPKYNETQLRREFLDPFFKALGWDVTNELGYAEQFKDVIHEDAIKVGDTTKAPDYSFRIGGVRKFFVEAKKPSVNIKSDIHPSFQLRRYAWSAKLPISILTDFEEFSVYDCRIKPNKNDNASVARIYYQTFDNYLDDLDFIVNTFSKEAILKGSFDKYINSATKKRGTSEVDKVFLKEIENWRETLAKNIALRNKFLTIYELNFVVQRTIDRIIFLRIAEDRGVEEYRNLFNLTENENVYKQLYLTFEKADDKYNSGIFNFKKDTISANINIDDKVLKPILKRLYYPESPYEFSVLPADILGNIYEQFLGKTIRLTPSHQAKVEKKPEVRKAGGVYYTPKYIVDYIVKNTVGEKIKGKTPLQISKIKICDPACGSGSFLIQAYQFLLDYHLQFYQQDSKKHKNQIFQISENNFQLTTKEKKRILLNNIFGVDIDQQAIEVTKLSLLLKVLEGENKETLNQQLKFFQERALPNLYKNIKCGNSLIGTDYYEDKNFAFFENDEIRKVNAFDWEKEFADIFANGGFDCVIGNPPWIDIKGLPKKEVEYYFNKYNSTFNRMNVFAVFTEKALCILSNKGIFGFIIPNSIISQSSYHKLRKNILHNYHICSVVRVPDNVFDGVIVESVIITIQNHKTRKKTKTVFFDRKIHLGNIDFSQAILFNKVNQEIWFEQENFYFNIFSSEFDLSICKKVNNLGHPLENFAYFSLGATPYDKYKGHSQEEIKNKMFHANEKLTKEYRKLLNGGDISRYCIQWNEKKWLKYGNWLGAPRKPKFFKEKRILIRQIVSGNPLKIYSTITTEDFVNTQSIFNILISSDTEMKIEYFLGILNSNLINFYHKHVYLDQSKNTFQKILIQNAKKLPIPKIDFSNPKEKAMHDQLVSLVEQMLLVQKQFHSANIERDKKLYQQKIEILDSKIDKLVYALYGLTDEEIGIVENVS